MFRHSHFSPARIIFGKKAAVQLALLKVGVEIVLRVGSYLQGRNRYSATRIR